MSDFYQHLKQQVTFAGVWSYAYHTHHELTKKLENGSLEIPEYMTLTDQLAEDTQRRADEITRLFHTPEVPLSTQDGRTTS